MHGDDLSDGETSEDTLAGLLPEAEGFVAAALTADEHRPAACLEEEVRRASHLLEGDLHV